ncbi:MAG: Gfo/Idh/MocA family oxidoreductase [Chloroflexota bacterium]|nr:Gfo/Idh/MocA family oxidoreductase [Chloroflexota bacterium]
MPTPQPLNVGVVGCGTISAAYLKTFSRLDTLKLVAAADIDFSRARAVATTNPGVRALSPEELMADAGVDLVLNLTIPAAHAEVARRAIGLGKSVYGEKPLATSTAEGRKIVDAAAVANVRVGCAPDTVLGTGIQTARKAVDDGLVGTPISAIAILGNPGPERWHPNPDFYYLPGGGPLLDMGPYYITALITMLGPVASVIGAASHTRDSRRINAGPREGETFPVATDTHVTGVLRHVSGALSTLFMSFDTVATVSARIEVHGEQGSLVAPDPNTFAGEVRLRTLGASEWQTLPVSAGYIDSSRGIGVADLAATPAGHEPRAGGQLAFHVLEVMESLLISAHAGRVVNLESTCERPSPVPLQSVGRPSTPA